MVHKPRLQNALISQIYVPDDEHIIDSHVCTFGVTRALIGNSVAATDEPLRPNGSFRDALVFPRPALRPGARRGAAAGSADPLQGQ